MNRSWHWLLAALTWTSVASAHGGGAGYTPDVSDLPPGPLKRQILDVERRVKEGKRSPGLVKQPLGDALRAAERARGARASGDGRHGGMLEKLAEQHVRVANALLNAAERERKAAAEAKRARELTVKVKRAEALLTEQHARVGRLQTEVNSLEAKVKGDAQRTKDREKERIDTKDKKKASP